MQAKVDAGALEIIKIRKCSELDVPESLLDGFTYTTEEELSAKIVQLAEHTDGKVDKSTKAVANKLLGSSTPPGSGNNPDSGTPDRTGWSDQQYIAEAERELRESKATNRPRY